MPGDPAAALVIAGDTIVELDGVIMGKPSSADEARHMLTALRGRDHSVTTGLAVASPWMAELLVDHETSIVSMRHYSSEETEAYIASGEPLRQGRGIRRPGRPPRAGGASAWMLPERGWPPPVQAVETCVRRGARTRPPAPAGRVCPLPVHRRAEGHGGGDMNILGMGFLELLVVFFIAFIVLGPERNDRT